MSRASTQVLAAIGLALGLGCKDPSVGPPPRKLEGDQALLVAGHILKQRPSPKYKADVTLGGGKIRYLGTDLRPDPATRGGQLRVAHYFEALQPVDKPWKVFVHIHAGDSRSILINADHVPVDNLYPTDKWQPGQIIEDSYAIGVPPDGPSELAGFIGFYRFDDRLPVDAAEGHDGTNRIPAFRVKVTGDSPGLPTYKVPRRQGEITVDGELGDPGWRDVPSTGAFVRTDNGSSPRYRTEARLTWDEQYLYASFYAQDEDVWGKFQKDDDPIYSEEVVEVFLDADGDGKTYNELQVSPHNVRFDAYFPARRQGMDLAWNSGMESAVKVFGTLDEPSDRDEGWSAELRIPVSQLAAVPRWPPQPGDKWRFNLYRLEWHSNRKVNEGSAFSPPLVGDFHHLPRFGYLEFAP